MLHEKLGRKSNCRDSYSFIHFQDWADGDSCLLDVEKEKGEIYSNGDKDYGNGYGATEVNEQVVLRRFFTYETQGLLLETEIISKEVETPAEYQT